MTIKNPKGALPGSDDTSKGTEMTPFSTNASRYVTSKPAGPLLLGIWLMILALLLVSGASSWTGTTSLALTSITLFLAGMITLARIFPTSAWSPASIYLLTFGVFHLGLTPYWVLGEMPPSLTRGSDAAWFFGEYGKEALYIVDVGLASYILGAVMLSAVIRRAPEPNLHIDAPRLITIAGSVALIVSIALWLYHSVQAGGIEFYTLPYLRYFALIGETPIPDLYLIIGFALCLTVISPARSHLRTFALITFAAWGAVSFFMGTRGNVLFPLAAAATVIAWRRQMPRLVSIALMLIATLFLVDSAKQVRQLGIGSSFSWADASPLNGLGELGSTIRVVAYMAQWHDEGMPFTNGTTYAVWPIRLLERLSGASSPVPDLRLFNVLIDARAGAIGGSAVGEAFHNFGIPGAVLVMAATGAIFAYFSAHGGRSPWHLAVYAAIAAPLFYQVRNSFVPVIPMTLMCLVAVAVMYALTKFKPGAKPPTSQIQTI